MTEQQRPKKRLLNPQQTAEFALERFGNGELRGIVLRLLCGLARRERRDVAETLLDIRTMLAEDE